MTSIPPAGWVAFSRASNIGRRAASVLPLAVGATRSTLFPWEMGPIAFSWGGVGSLIPSSLRPDCILGWRASKTVVAISLDRMNLGLD